MDLGYNQATCKELSTLEEDVRLSAASGFTAFELRFDMARAYLQTHTTEELRRLFEGAAPRAVTINAIMGINFADEQKWREMEEDLRFAGTLRELTGADVVLALPTRYEEKPPHTRDEIFADSVAALTRLARTAAAHGLRIAYEPIGAANWCVNSLPEAWDIVRAAGLPGLGLAVDAYNLYLHDRLESLAVMREIDPALVYIVHLNDARADLSFDELGNWDRALPGDGVIDCAAFLRAVLSGGYDGVISVEVLSHEVWRRPPREVIPEAFQKAKRLLALATEG